MAVKIRLKRLGKIHAPYYRIVVADARTKRDGRAIEEIGLYQPTHDPSVIQIKSDRALYWLGVGAQPTEQVMALLKITGDWQKHKGLPGQEGTLRVAEPKADKRVAFEAAAKVDMAGPEGEATTPRAKKTAKKPEAPVEKTEAPVEKTEADKPEAAKHETAKPEAAKPEVSAAETVAEPSAGATQPIADAATEPAGGTAGA